MNETFGHERNFCERCGKRLGKNAWDVHTCSPPDDEAERVASNDTSQERVYETAKQRHEAVPFGVRHGLGEKSTWSLK